VFEFFIAARLADLVVSLPPYQFARDQYMARQIMSADERAWMAIGRYSKSTHLRHSIRLIDQATLAVRNGLYTAASALLYITLERYLRSLAGWQPGQHVTFAQLSDAVLTLPPSPARDEAHALVTRILSAS
jgi:hypothetical protein